MDRFLIESPHEADDCKRVVKDVSAEGFLYNFDWGCEVGVHKAWAILEAENEAQVLRAVPRALRPKATATRIIKFDADQIKKWSTD